MVWILYYKERAQYNRLFIEQLISKGTSSGMDIKLVYVEDIQRQLENEVPEAVIARMINPGITGLLESYNIRVFNNFQTAYICNNKALTIEAVHNINITHIPTTIVSEGHTDDGNGYSYRNVYSNDIPMGKNDIMNTYNESLDRLQCGLAGYSDYVIKSVSGHGGKEVMLLSDFMCNRQAYGDQEIQVKGYYHEKYVIQPLIDCNGRDLRVYIIGKRIIGAVLRQSVSGFKSNFSLGGHVSLYELSEPQKRIVNKIIDAFDFDYVGIDFLVGENEELIFNEIEDVVGARMLSQCSDIDYAGMYIDYIKGHMP